MMPKRIDVWLKGWNQDHAAETEDEIAASVGCRLFIDGEELENVISVKTKMAYDFTTLVVEMIAPNFSVRTVTQDEWEKDSWSPLNIENGRGMTIASTET